jgi:hypothetical protein
MRVRRDLAGAIRTDGAAASARLLLDLGSDPGQSGV